MIVKNGAFRLFYFRFASPLSNFQSCLFALFFFFILEICAVDRGHIAGAMVLARSIAV